MEHVMDHQVSLNYYDGRVRMQDTVCMKLKIICKHRSSMVCVEKRWVMIVDVLNVLRV